MGNKKDFPAKKTRWFSTGQPPCFFYRIASFYEFSSALENSHTRRLLELILNADAREVVVAPCVVFAVFIIAPDDQAAQVERKVIATETEAQ